MELNWSTFVLEIINFLILVWILKRFLYKPVLEVINRRQAGIDKTLNDAESLRAEAENLQQQYNNRILTWEREQQQAREVLNHELDAERALRLAELKAVLEQEREKSQVAEARRQHDALRSMEESALANAARFAARLLQQGAGPETETRLVEIAISELQQLSAENIAELQNNSGNKPDSVVVQSAFSLAEQQCQKLEQALKNITYPDVSFRYEQNGGLLAGLCITIGAREIGINIRDELQGFTGLSHGD